MGLKTGLSTEAMDRPSLFTRNILVDQLIWLIRLRWFAVLGLVIAALVGTYVFDVLESSIRILICAGCLLFCNVLYYFFAKCLKNNPQARPLVLGLIQVEFDLIILTLVLYYSGGIVNPFFLFYTFHVIIAAIILPRILSYSVGLTAILLFGFLVINELNPGKWFGYYPLKLSAAGGLWSNPVYCLGVFTAFTCMVILSQYLTRIIIVRMTAKELEAAQHSDLLKAIIGAMSEGLIFINPEGDISISNPAAKLWKIKGQGRLDGDSVEDFPVVLSNHLLQLCAGKSNGDEVIDFVTHGSEPRHIEIKSCSVKGFDGTDIGHVIVGQDLTKHKQLEKDLRYQTEQITEINEMLKMTRVQMAQREKMVAIGQMAAGIAHEIGNPLASLSSVAQYLARNLKTHQDKEQLLLIEHQVERISSILKRMLSMARPATEEYKWTDINELIDNTVSLVRFDDRMVAIELENEPCKDLPMVWLNPQLLEQVLLNIFINAMDAMSAKQSSESKILTVTRNFKDSMVEIRISDTGIGMSPEIVKRAFESFFTTKEIGKGTGLGLFISYNLITEIDGTIKIESEPGKGSTVIIRIPVRAKKLLATADEQSHGLA